MSVSIPPPFPRIGIIGSAGAYGQWLSRFFTTRMGLEVLGSDPSDSNSATADTLIRECDVLVFSVPIRATCGVIEQYTALAKGREAKQLWIDITSVKAAPVQAMLASQAEVVGLHPMTAAPKAPTLKGRVLIVCQARLSGWQPWVESLLHHLRAEIVRTTPEKHDHIMALVQAMVHASHLSQARVLMEYTEKLGGLEALLPFRSTSFELDSAIFSRILSMNPAIYEDIQFENPHVPAMLDALQAHLQRLRDQVQEGSDASRNAFRKHFLSEPRQQVGETTLAQGNYTFERVGYLLSDLAGDRSLSVHLPEDRPGSLRALLHVFEHCQISLSSLHSSRTPAGEVHFRLGFDTEVSAEQITNAISRIHAEGIGHVLEHTTLWVG